MPLNNYAGIISLRTRALKILAGVFVFLSAFALSFIEAPKPPAPGVVTALHFNEGTGTTTADISGNSHTGTLVNGPAWVAGRYGQGINFDGINDYVNIADHANFTLDPAQNYTWGAWVKNNNFKEWSTIWSQTTNASNYLYFYAHTTVHVDGGGGPITNGIGAYWITSAGTLALHSNNNVLTAGQWSYIAITYNASQPQASRFTIYVNGVDVTNRSVVGSTGTLGTINPTNINIGSNQIYSGETLNGAIDDVRYYRRLLTLAEIQADMNTPVEVDNTAPTVNVTAPAAGNVSGTISVTANASDNVGVAGVQFLLNGVNLGAEDVTAPYSVSWNTSTVANSNDTLTARARDAAGNTTTSAGVIVTVNNDTELPTVTITAPAAGTVSGAINVTANASDNIGVTGVQFLLDGTNLGAEDVSAPYSVSWNTTTIADGNHSLTARARDAAGNLKTSTAVVVNVLNNPPDTQFPTVSITAPAAGNVSGTINVNANANDNVGVVGVQFLLNGANLGAEDLTAPYSVSWNTTTVGNSNDTLTARARDAAGNTTTSTNVVVTVNNDIVQPTVSITAPAAGNVSGTINVNATANDNVGVVGVQFLLNGANLGAEDLTASYSVSWNTTTVANGNYTLTARARDAAGNTTTSGGIIVTVSNAGDGQLPTVNITSPAAGNVSGAINVNADASDNVGVVGVQFLLNGANLGAEDLTAPYSVSWNTITTANGNYTLTARARDAAGNLGISSPINVTVSNISNLIAAYPCREGTGTSVADISGNSHTGTLTNGPAWVAGRYGQGINFDGSNDYLNIADHANFTLNPAQNYTWSSWVKNNNFQEWGTLWSQTINASNYLYFYAHTIASEDGGGGPVTNGIGVYWITSAGTLALHSNNNVLTAGQWSHITITYNGSLAQASRFTIYVNGADVTNRSAVGSTGTIATINPTSIRMGMNQAFNSDYLNASVDDVRYYNRLLTLAEIQSDMNTSLEVDNVAPAVNITAPVAGSVSGTISVTANASDNAGVAGVQFLLDGVNLGAEDVTAPYSVLWNTATATNGNHTLTARARDAAGNTTTSQPVNVVVGPDFSFILQTATRNITATGNTNFIADVVFHNGFTSNNIALSVTGFPQGVTGNYVVNPLTQQGQAQLNVNSNNAALGTYTLTLSATSEGITHTQQATLIVAGPEDFALAASPVTQSVVAGNSTTYTITLSETNDYINPVTLSVVGLPAGVTATFNPAAPTPAATSTLTLTTSTGVVNGTYSLTVRGVSGSFTRTTPITLTVSSIPPSSLQLPPGFNVINVGGVTWDQPMGTVFTESGQKMFVWEKKGIVYVCNRNAQQLYNRQNTPVLNIEQEVGNWHDQGLMSIALDPNFTDNGGGYIYLLYMVDRHHLMNFGTPNYNPSANDYNSATIGRVTRYKVITNGNGEMIIDPSPAERKILIGETRQTGVPQLHDSHGLGTLIFAADGTLLVSTGDGASYYGYDVGSQNTTYYQQALDDDIIRDNENVGAFRSQILNCHNGKLLRIDPATGNGVSSNPFYDAGAPRSPKSRVWALGFRNPYRITIKPGTGSTNPAAGDIGEIYVGDVGFGDYEELNIINEPGVNCGWPLFEGLNEQATTYYPFTTLNRDEPNPLAGGSCPQYFQFRQLIKQATADGVTTLFNPCSPSTQIPNTTNNKRFFHHRPALEWFHGDNIAKVGIFTGNTASTATIGTPQSGVIGEPFRGNCSIGGCWYTGTLFPESYRNTYFQADYGARWLKNFKIDFTDVLQEVRNFASGFGAIISIAENPADGTIYCVDIGDNTIKRISYGGNQFPVVVMSSDKTYGPSALTVNFIGNTSFDPDGGPLTYLWNFGDNTTSVEENPSHVFSAPPNTPRKFVVKLTVTDNLNAIATDSIIISVNNTPPAVNITSPVKNSTYRIGVDTTYTLSAVVTDAQHSPGQLKYQWQTILRHNNHEHPGPIDTVKNTTSTIVRVGCNGDDYYYLFRLKVTDAAGLSTLDSSIITPNCPAQRSSLVSHEFNVLQEQEENLVKWVTERDIKVNDFEVEVSADGHNFFTINRQRSKNTTERNEYSFLDKNTLPGESYYRLSFLENGSVIGYSRSIKVFQELELKRNGLQISPNPATGNFLIEYNAVNKGPVTIRFTDVNGNVVNTVYKTAEKGQNSFYMQNYPEWKAGVYLISVHQGKNIQWAKLLYHKPG
jgi:hypothetical protein